MMQTLFTVMFCSLLAACAAKPEVVIVHDEPAPVSAPKSVSYSPQIDHACARLVRAIVKHPKADPSATKDGRTFCSDVPAHASKSLRADLLWLNKLTKRINGS